MGLGVGVGVGAGVDVAVGSGVGTGVAGLGVDVGFGATVGRSSPPLHAVRATDTRAASKRASFVRLDDMK